MPPINPAFWDWIEITLATGLPCLVIAISVGIQGAHERQSSIDQYVIYAVCE